MKETKQSKEYKTPQFKFVKTDESNKVFFATSGTPGESGPSFTGGINSMDRNGGSAW